MAVSLEPFNRFWYFHFWVKALDIYFHLGPTAGLWYPYNRCSTAAAAGFFGQQWWFQRYSRPRVSQKTQLFSDYFCKLTNCALGPPKHLGRKIFGFDSFFAQRLTTHRSTVDQFTNEIQKLLRFLGHPTEHWMCYYDPGFIYLHKAEALTLYLRTLYII